MHADSSHRRHLVLEGRRILVSGGAGAIGSNLVAAVARANAVRVVDDFSSGWVENVPSAAELVVGDLLDAAVLNRAFQDGVDVVFHLAALFANQNSIENPERDLLVNGLGSLRLLERARAAGVQRFVFASSSCVYGLKQGVCREDDTVLDPETPYAITKLLGERYTAFYHRFFGLPTVILRYFNVYGLGERPGPYRSVIPNFVTLALKGEALPITGNGAETRDFTFVSDAVAATVAAAVSPKAVGGTYNVGTGVETSVLALAGEINRLTGNRAEIEFRPRRNWDTINRRVADVTRAGIDLDYRPKVSLADGLLATYRWLARRPQGGS